MSASKIELEMWSVKATKVDENLTTATKPKEIGTIVQSPDSTTYSLGKNSYSVPTADRFRHSVDQELVRTF